MQPRHNRETSSPVRPSLVYFIADSFYGAATRQPCGKMPGGCRVDVFDRTGGLQEAIYSVEHSGDNSTAALSLQPSHARGNSTRAHPTAATPTLAAKAPA